MRNLASVQIISDLKPIPDADLIEVSTILGWKCIVKKGEFKVGDKCVYFEIDSILPDKPVFEFMRDRKFRVRTIKLRKHISQGLAMPLKEFGLKDTINVNTDLTDLLKIKKYEKYVEEENDNKKNKFFKHIISYLLRFKIFRKLLTVKKIYKGFPIDIPKTDEIRVQIRSDIKEHEGEPFSATEKLDGTSVTYFLKMKKDRKIDCGVCSRTNRYYKNDNKYYESFIKFEIENKLKLLLNLVSCHQIVLQGELIGPAIQGNKYNLKHMDVYIFNMLVYDDNDDPTKYRIFSNFDLVEHLAYVQLKSVPVVDLLFTLNPDIDKLVKKSIDGSVLTNYKTPREGIVIRKYDDPSISFKVINPNFLLKYFE